MQETCCSIAGWVEVLKHCVFLKNIYILLNYCRILPLNSLSTRLHHDSQQIPRSESAHPHSLREPSSVGSNCHMCWKLSHNSQLVFGGSRQGCNEMSYTPSQLTKSAFCLQPLCGTVRTRYELPTSLIGGCCNRKKWSVTVIERLLCLGKLLIRKTIASSSLYAVSLIVLLLAGLISLARI